MNLKDPISMHALTLTNRLVMPPMATNKSDNGVVTEALCQHYEARARGGYIGLIITEHSYVDVQGKASPQQISIASDEAIEGLHTLTDAVHHVGSTKIIAQLNHAGAAADLAGTGLMTVGPSAIVIQHPWKKDLPVPHELTKAEVAEIAGKFAAAAGRAKKAGYDGVEIHSAHGYLLNQFYSPLTNVRHDEYGGGSVENRTRFHVEVIEAVRRAVGSDFTVAVRLGGADFMEGGSTIADSVAAAAIFERAGVDFIDMSGGMCGYVRKDKTGPGYFSDMTAAVKKAVSIPVILTGGITTREAAEQLLQAQAADLIGVGRALLQDPLWGQKNMQ
ncbi:NADH:flavin oxidoreductase [Megasphaera cerevisiae]|uniref:NADH:flavin oxidoreductase n=1 Tax=Megasphaera cerevisiae TaxID=39029 RepID=UPI0009430C28|nr:NADH:flavin oxidoreductase [Megasphaera cerevisiae]OKY53691.1 NADH oxidase [Megasphaera cerevisiae]